MWVLDISCLDNLSQILVISIKMPYFSYQLGLKDIDIRDFPTFLKSGPGVC